MPAISLRRRTNRRCVSRCGFTRSSQTAVSSICAGDRGLDPAVLSPGSYVAGQALGRAVRAAGGPGIVYPSVRDPGGECLAAFRTNLLH